MWKNSNLTPLERPQEFTQLAITPADAARLQAASLVPPGGPNQPDDPGRVLEERTIEPIRGELRSSQIIDPADGRIPWNEAYKERLAALRNATLSAFDNPEQRPPLERCLGSNGAPPMQPNPEGNYYQFVQTPDTTVIMSEVSHDARIVRMNSMHSPAAMASPQTTVIERFTRVSDRELNYVFTISDPTYYTRAWTGETHLLRSKDRMFEVACHEGNYSMRNILEAARAQDAAAQ